MRPPAPSVPLPERPLELRAFVPGRPVTQGSKRAYAFKGRDGKYHANVKDDAEGDERKLTEWRGRVYAEVRPLAEELGCPWRGGVHLDLTFWFRRPKKHYRTGRFAHLLRDDAPIHHIGQPDLVKVVRAVEDALKAVVWLDDSQVAAASNRKLWLPGAHTGIEQGEGVWLRARSLEDPGLLGSDVVGRDHAT